MVFVGLHRFEPARVDEFHGILHLLAGQLHGEEPVLVAVQAEHVADAEGKVRGGGDDHAHVQGCAEGDVRGRQATLGIAGKGQLQLMDGVHAMMADENETCTDKEGLTEKSRILAGLIE